MSELERVLADFRRRLLVREIESVRVLTTEYAAVWRSLREMLVGIWRDVLERNASGRQISAGILMRERRVVDLMAEIVRHVEDWGRNAERHTRALQRFGIDAGEQFVNASTAAQIGRLPAASANLDALRASIGYASDGSPLRVLFDSLGQHVGEHWRRALHTGIALGQGVREVERAARKATGTGMIRGLLIARTEMLRAYRASARETAQANAGLYDGWVWVASLSRRTCPACFAMHGTFHKMVDPFNEHPNGRCQQVWRPRDPDFRGPIDSLPSAEDWLRKLPPSQQEEIFGGAVDLWRNGDVPLSAFATLRTNRIWGDSIGVTPQYILRGDKQ